MLRRGWRERERADHALRESYRVGHSVQMMGVFLLYY